ncbi:MAG: DNA mismatch repair endonuclease MutL [Candidatus Omnitrophica bacterium]|nr:DNA mismatch repair endonuclease MutL [Candidatus Omnitrophota bacterium]
MHKKIVILPQEVVNKIAAGEVVERPASVVKELVENSLDAEASLIEVEIKEAGKKFIRVTDNGIGMSRQDALLCTKSHATSKISSIEDLERIFTLGFRGEALSSIASVSLMRVVTKNEEEDLGIELEIEGGEIKAKREVSVRRGTSIAVRNLFYNTPARKKFLKSSATELAHIIHILEQFALAYPEVNFRLIHQEKELFNFLPQESLKERIKEVLGKELADSLLEVEFKDKELEITGFVSKPEFFRFDRYGQFLFVNRRAVTNKSFSHALSSVYQELLPKERFPVAIIFLEIAPKLLDVNVHPTKREVRFQNEGIIHDSLVKAIKEALTNSSLILELKEKFYSSFQDKAEEIIPPLVKESFSPREINLVSSDTPFIHKLPFLQIANLYIVISDDEGILIIDQHAASERIIFGILSEKEKPIETQNLLIPEIIDLAVREAEILKENLDKFKEIGFEIEEFGRNSFQVRKIPTIISRSPRELILEIISEIYKDESKIMKLEKEKLLSLIACHSAVRRGDVLGELQISRLIQDLKSTKFPWTCPHGRPTMIRLNWEELQRMFKR